MLFYLILKLIRFLEHLAFIAAYLDFFHGLCCLVAVSIRKDRILLP